MPGLRSQPRRQSLYSHARQPSSIPYAIPRQARQTHSAPAPRPLGPRFQAHGVIGSHAIKISPAQPNPYKTKPSRLRLHQTPVAPPSVHPVESNRDENHESPTPNPAHARKPAPRRRKSHISAERTQHPRPTSRAPKNSDFAERTQETTKIRPWHKAKPIARNRRSRSRSRMPDKPTLK